MPARLTIFQVFSTPRTLFFFQTIKFHMIRAVRNKARLALGNGCPGGPGGATAAPRGREQWLPRDPRKV